MQYRDMKSKPLVQLSKKYNISNSRLYQIWRGQEFNRIQWNDLAVASSTNVIDKQNEERQAERDFQNKFDSAFTALKNKIYDTKISKSTNPALEEDFISDSKTKKLEGGNLGLRLFASLILFHLPNFLKISWICIRKLVLK